MDTESWPATIDALPRTSHRVPPRRPEGMLARHEARRLVAKVVSGLLLLRFALSFVRAAEDSRLGVFLHQLTQPLVAPFRGQLPLVQLTPELDLELDVFLAFCVYFLAFALLSRLVRALRN